MSFSFRFGNALTRFKVSSRVTFSLLGRSIFTFRKGFIGISEPIMFERVLRGKCSHPSQRGVALLRSSNLREATSTSNLSPFVVRVHSFSASFRRRRWWRLFKQII